MNIGLIDVDSHNFPNLALMKLSASHKACGNNVEWYTPFGQYDIVYMSKVFTFTQDFTNCIANANTLIKGGTGYDVHSKLTDECDMMQPDYSIYPKIDNKTAYGFLTRGCPNSCKWCVVPTKEGKPKPYMDIDEIAVDGRKNIVLMDNNILGIPDYAEQQFEKIISMKLKVDFNQAMDARLVDDRFARLIARTKWLRQPTFGCDTQAQIEPCIKAIRKIQENGYKGNFMLYTMLHGELSECLERVSMWRDAKWNHKIDPFAQPMLNLNTHEQHIPQWQMDMARWVNNKVLYRTTDFANFSPRNGFKCEKHIRMQLS